MNIPQLARKIGVSDAVIYKIETLPEYKPSNIQTIRPIWLFLRKNWYYEEAESLLGDNLCKIVRVLYDLTQEKLGKIIGVDASIISKIENDEYYLDSHLRIKLERMKNARRTKYETLSEI